MFSLRDKRAFVTGGTAGIGLAVARSFVRAGASVTVAGRRDGGDIATGIGASFVRLDVSREQDLAAALNAASPLDVLVLNAGVTSGQSLAEMSAEEIQSVLEVNIQGVVYGLKHGQGVLSDGGSIIVTSSVSALFASPGSSIYSASKAAVSSLVRSAAIELGHRGIRVNAVCPGGIKTEMALPDALFENLCPLGRIGATEDLVGVYNLLASDASAYLTGQDIVVDGGLTAGVTPQVLEKIFG